MSQAPLSKRSDAEAVLRACSIWGKPAFGDVLFGNGGIGRSLSEDALETAQHFLASEVHREAPQVITDLNLLTEYRHGARPPFSWLSAFLPPGVAER